VAGVALVIDY